MRFHKSAMNAVHQCNFRNARSGWIASGVQGLLLPSRQRRAGSPLSFLLWSVLACSLSLPGKYVAATYVSWGVESARWQQIARNDVYQAVALGGHHVLALARNGTLRAWGDNYYGQCNTPPADRLVAIAAGRYHSLALRYDGAVVVWGDNSKEQCLSPTALGFIAIGAGDWHCLAVQSDGSVLAWGCNDKGQCNVPNSGKFTAVAGGHSHSLALSRDGTIVAWGSNGDGQCDAPVGNDFTAIAAGAFHNIALRSDGSIAAWGQNEFGQCNAPTGRDFTAIAAGAFHSLALKADGTVVAWGHDDYGQCRVPIDNHATAIMAGRYMSAALMADATESGSGNRRQSPPKPPARTSVSPPINSKTTAMAPARPEGDGNAIFSTLISTQSSVKQESLPVGSEATTSQERPDIEGEVDSKMIESVQGGSTSKTPEEETVFSPAPSNAEVGLAPPALVEGPPVILDASEGQILREEVGPALKEDTSGPQNDRYQPATTTPRNGPSSLSPVKPAEVFSKPSVAGPSPSAEKPSPKLSGSDVLEDAEEARSEAKAITQRPSEDDQTRSTESGQTAIDAPLVDNEYSAGTPDAVETLDGQMPTGRISIDHEEAPPHAMRSRGFTPLPSLQIETPTLPILALCIVAGSACSTLLFLWVIWRRRRRSAEKLRTKDEQEEFICGVLLEADQRRLFSETERQ